jgi:peptide-methionine (S)-S-oxide reductase
MIISCKSDVIGTKHSVIDSNTKKETDMKLSYIPILIIAMMIGVHTMAANSDTEKATLAGGCFWCLEPIFEELKGVEKAVVGYSGGHVKNPTYKQVVNGNTGHAEAVQVTYNPEVISYRELMQIFFTMHNPTTLNRQGPDVGPQYRSAVFYHDDEQKTITEEVIEEFEKKKVWDDPFVTEVTEFEKFYVAEDYHQEYYYNNPNQGYCQIIIDPKVAKFRQKFEEKLKETAQN